MKRRVFLAGLITAICTTAANAEIAQVPNQDTGMIAAIAKAQATLPAFFDRLAKSVPGDSNFAVKIHYKVNADDGEHIWANKVEHKDGMVSATINNEPNKIADLKFGQRVTVPVTQITDWMYSRDGKIHGGQTIRAVLPYLPKPQAEQYRAMLAPE
jgi:uncharacterized protein YegJ (DUF2314 family)